MPENKKVTQREMAAYCGFSLSHYPTESSLFKSFTTTGKTSNEKNKSKNEKYVIKLKEIMIIDKATPGGSS